MGFTTGHPGEVHSLSTENGGLVREKGLQKWIDHVLYLDLARNGKIYSVFGDHKFMN